MKEMQKYLNLFLQGTDSMSGKQAGLANNVRPRQNLNRRSVRTNIDFQFQGECSSQAQSSQERQFQANAWLREIPTTDFLSDRFDGSFF